MKKVIATILCLGFVFVTYSQQTEKINSGTYQPGWYLGANAGVNWFMGEGDNIFSLKQDNIFSLRGNIGFIGRAVVGYDFNHVIGLRAMLGYADHNWPDVRLKKKANGSYDGYSFGSQNLTADLTVNLSSWMEGFNPNRVFDLSVFGGAGLAHRNKADFSDDWFGAVGRGGLQGDFHLTKQLDLNLIAEANIVGDKYNDDVASGKLNGYPAITVGITYHLRERSKPIEIQSKPEIVEKQAATEPVAPPQPVAKEEPKQVVETKEVAVVKTQIPELEVEVFYTIGKTKIKTPKQQAALAKAVDYLHTYPDARILISGYADNSTGTAAVNKQLSTKRAQEVSRMLIDTYSISADRIITEWHGDKVQPYSQASSNRLVKLKLVSAQ